MYGGLLQSSVNTQGYRYTSLDGMHEEGVACKQDSGKPTCEKNMNKKTFKLNSPQHNSSLHKSCHQSPPPGECLLRYSEMVWGELTVALSAPATRSSVDNKLDKGCQPTRDYYGPFGFDMVLTTSLTMRTVHGTIYCKQT